MTVVSFESISIYRYSENAGLNFVAYMNLKDSFSFDKTLRFY